MKYTVDEVFDFIEQEDVKFIRLAFCDIGGRQKNISIMPDELGRAFSEGIPFDASAIYGFGDDTLYDLLLFPKIETLNVLPWRPAHGKVVRMFCDIKYPDGTPFEKDSRRLLQDAVNAAQNEKLSVSFSSEYKFYLFKTDENGEPTKVPLDRAGYMDVSPYDKGENVRREICLTLLDMGIKPENSHHAEGPGQNEIDFKCSDALSAADNAMNFISVVEAAAIHNGMYADFSPKPLDNEHGNDMRIKMSVKTENGNDVTDKFSAGILAHIREITAFLNPCEDSYKRLSDAQTPKTISCSAENRLQVLRIITEKDSSKRIELRSPDSTANPYIAYALLIFAGLDGIKNELSAQPTVSGALSDGDESASSCKTLPQSLEEAKSIAKSSKFLSRVLPHGFMD